VPSARSPCTATTSPRRSAASQLEGDGRARPRHEAHALAVTPNPAPEIEGLVLGHDHVRGPVLRGPRETTGQLPVAHVSGERDEPTLEMRDTLGAFHARHVRVQARRWADDSWTRDR
jgi:hypothetical protein